MPAIERFYFRAAGGQLHGRRINALGKSAAPPLLCLHPAPYSSAYFTTVMPLLNKDRDVIALDYPGYGGSDPSSSEPSIEDFAAAIGEFVEHAATPADILGFHTGCLVAAEIALSRPDAVRRLVLCDVPYFTADVQAGLRDKMAQPLPLDDRLQSLAGAWDFDVAKRVGDLGLQRAFELFVEHLRSAPKDHLAFAAAFSYDCEQRFVALDADIVVIATQSGLRDATLAAHNAIDTATLVDASEITSAVFETGAQAIAAHINRALGD